MSITSIPIEVFEPKARALIENHPQDDGTDDDNLASSILSSAPKLSTRYNSFTVNPSKNDEIWTIREVANGEEQLYAKGKSVYWTRNSLIIKSFNFTDHVVQVFWCRFGEEQDHVCVALVSGLNIFNQLGQHFQLLLPFSYKQMYHTKSGVIIERSCDSSDDTSLPIIFALTHPTKEVSPILFKPLSSNMSILTYSMPQYMSIVGCLELSFTYCLVYNSQENQHGVWKVRRTTAAEIEEFGRENDASTTNTFTLSQSSLNLSSRQRSGLLHQSHQSTNGPMNFSPKVDIRNRQSNLGNLAASRLGAGELTTNATTNIALKSFNSAQTFNTMSTPNKNRIINYLRDNIEEPILPELLFEQIWVENTTSSSKASKFFSTSDFTDENFIVLVMSSANQVKVVKCTKSDTSSTDDSISLGRSSIIAALDAAPITSMKMMVIVDLNKSFVLYTGFDRITQITVPQSMTTSLRLLPSSSPAFKHSNTNDMTPIQMSSARKRTSLGDRSSLGSELSFNQIFQALSPVPHAKLESKSASSPLCFADIKKIEHVIGQSVVISNNNTQRVRLEIPSICQTIYVKRLLESMKSSVSRELGLFMTTNWYQTRRSPDQPELMSANNELDLFKNWFLSSLGLEHSIFSSRIEISLNDLRLTHQSPTKKSRRAKDIECNPMMANVHTLFFAMHLVFEDMLLVKLNYGLASSLAELLLLLACLLRLKNYQDYYWLKFPNLQDKFSNYRNHLANIIPRVETLYKPPFFQQNPPSVTGFIVKLITLSNLKSMNLEQERLLPYPVIKGVTEYSFIVISIFCEMFNLDSEKSLVTISNTRSTCPTEIPLPIRPFRSKRADERVVELLVKFKKDRNFLSPLPEGINLYLWDAILNCRDSPPTDWNEACFDLIGRMDLVNLVRGRTDTKLQNGDNQSEDKEDMTLKLLFPDDIRVSEAHRMLASDTPVEFSVVQRQGATEDESRDETNRHLYLLNIRTMAMPVGRGAICLRTYSPVIGESFEVPRLELSGRASSEDRPIEYNHDISVYPWPFFHNGVAAGLTICAASANNIIDSTWINYNRPRSNIAHGADVRDRDLTATNINNEHAGFLFALGLNGHLEKLSLMALHDYLCQNNDLTKLAILLGMSAAKRGSKDLNIIKVLSIHVDALLPPNSTELDVSAPVHAASIMGVGLLYQGSGDSHISKVLLEEIGRSPGPETNSLIDRESYSLSAGLAFGLVNLCKGDSSTISSSDQLRLYMLGGKRKVLTAAQRERYLKQDNARGEQEYIDTNITSPGGTLGLGLMYHKTANESVANWMRAPDTQTLLEKVRPDSLILRMLSYGLIMWDDIKPSEQYINSHIPTIVSIHAFQRNSPPAPASRLAAAAAAAATMGTSSSLASNGSIDYELISQAYCHIVTGCCMAIAMRFAGTADEEAFKTIYKHTKMLIALGNKPILAELAGRSCIESCLNVLITSLAVVMAGTGDLRVMRVCRYLRSRLTQSCVFYGSYMAVHIALGILFLGSCRYSLSTSSQSIGALVCALYPIYPNHSSDNRYHLQALRHLYVLAAEPRLLIPRDILTERPVYVNIIVKLNRQRDQGSNSNNKHSSLKQAADQSGEQPQDELHLRAPCLMPEVDKIERVYINDDRYWRIEINDKEALVKCLMRDHGYLSVKQKAHSSNNQLVQNIESYILDNTQDGVIKCRKSSALAECVKEDRVEQYAALNELLTRSSGGRHSQSDRRQFLSLIYEQIYLAKTLADGQLTNKINLLRSIESPVQSVVATSGGGDHNVEDQLEELWFNYATKKTDWVDTDKSVAHFVALNNLRVTDEMDCSDLEDLFEA